MRLSSPNPDSTSDQIIRNFLVPFSDLAPVAQRVDNFVLPVNSYLADKMYSGGHILSAG